jgi:peptidoglycan hydrolase FlgJ
MEIQGINPQSLQKSADLSPSRVAEEKKLQDTCKQFESVFLNQLFTQMRKSIPKNDLFGDGKDREMFDEMMDTERAKSWSDTGGIGLANLLYQQMKNNAV